MRLSASLLVREPTPRYTLNGTKGSFVKYGIDQQEDQLKAGLKPGDAGFGIESGEFSGILYTDQHGIPIPEKIATLPGNWAALFQNIADVLLRGATPAIRMEEILQQLRILEKIHRPVS